MSSPDLIAEVYARTGDGSWSCGSAYAVGPTLLLTAAHVVLVDGVPARTVKVRLLGTVGLVEGTVVWHRYDRSLDLALLRLAQPDQALPPGQRPVRWGRLVTSATGTRVSATGFPEVQRQPDGVRETEQLSGRVNPLTGAKAGWYAIAVDNPPTRVVESTTPWRGMSGAAVFCDGLLVAVVAGDPAGFSSSRLTAVPVAPAAAEPDFRALVEADTARPLAVEPAELRRLFAEPPRAHSPAALLRADVEAVPFHGRADLLTVLEAWCAEPGAFSTRLVVGGGGEGKSRLGVELGKRLRARGWVTGRLAEDVPADTLASLEALALPLLLVVDYAETRRNELHLLVRHLLDLRHPVRLLFLARSAGEWVTQLAAASPYLSSVVAAPVEQLEPLDRTPAGRIAAWRGAVDSLAQALPGLPGYDGVPWHDVRDRVVARPPARARRGADHSVLAVQMDALASLLEAGSPLATSALPTEDVLLVHERRYWEKAATTRGLTLGPESLQGAVAAASAWSAADEAEALPVLSRVFGLRDLDEDRSVEVARWISDLYQSSGQFWGSLQPDRLAEHFIGTVLRKRPRLFHDVAAVATERQIAHLLTVLARAQAHQPHLADIVTELVTEHATRFGVAAVAVITETENPGPLVTALDALLAEPDTLPLEFLRDLLEAIPKSTERLMRQATVVAELVADRCRVPAGSEAAADRHRYAEALSGLATRLAGEGRREEAIAAMRDVVFLYRELFAADPDTFGPHLAESLAGLANRYAGRDRKAHPSQGDLARARQAVKEAVDIAERLARSDPEEHTPRLARYLGSYANRLHDLRQYAQAIVQAKRAVAGYERLVGADADDHLADLLVTLTKRLTFVGQRDEALATIERAVAIRRRLVERTADPASEAAAKLARVLSQLAVQLDESGKAVAALGAAEQAAEIAHRLADTRPDGNLAPLAEYLGDVARLRARLGRADEAAESFEQVLAILRRLVKTDPSRYLPRLERALYDLATSSVAAPDVTLACLEEAADIGRQLSGADLLEYGPRLVNTLTLLAKRYAEGERREAALEAVRAMAVTCRQLAAEQPATYLQTYALNLMMLARREVEQGYVREAVDALRAACAAFARTVAGEREPELVERARLLVAEAEQHAGAGRMQDAVEVFQQAVVTYGQALAAPADAELVARAPKLVRKARQLAAAGQDDDALTAFQQAAEAYGQLAEWNLTQYVWPYTHALMSAANRLGSAGRDDEALVALETVALAYQRAADADPARYTVEYARSLVPVAKKLMRLGRNDEARTAVQRALEVYRAAGESDVAVNRLYYAQLLETASRLLATMGQAGDSLAALRRAAAIYRGLAESDPEAYLSQYAQVNEALARRLGEAGNLDEALAHQREASDIYRKLVTVMPGKYVTSYASCQALLARWLSGLGRGGRTLPVLTEAVLAWRRLEAPVPYTHRAQLAEFLGRLAEQLAVLGRDRLSVEVTRRGIAIWTRLAEADPKAYAVRSGRAVQAASRRLVARGRANVARDLLDAAIAAQRWRLTAANGRELPGLTECLTAMEADRAALDGTEAI